MAKNIDLNSLTIGSKIEHFFIISKIETKTTRNNKTYLDLLLKDKMVSLPAKLWDNYSDIQSSSKEGDIVKVAASIDEFNGQRQLNISKIRLAVESDNVSPDDFLPKSHRELEEMKEELRIVINSFQNEYLKKVIIKLLEGDRFDLYSRVPAGKAWHHSYIHGLLEHTLEIIKICDLMCQIHPELNRDLLLSGAIMHDYGKTEELKADASFDYTDKGKLIGHIVISATEIEIAARSIEGFPEDLKNQLIHLVLSHQGKLEYATPVEPKTLEAIVLYQADELSAKTNAYKVAIEAEKNNTTGWTRFLPLAGTALMIPQNQQNGDDLKDTLFD